MSNNADHGRLFALAPANASRPSREEAIEILTKAITTGELDPELSLLHDTITQRLNTLHTIRSANALLDFQPGDRVRLNCGAQPNYLHGALGTISGLVDQQVLVTLDQPVGRFRSGQLRCPPLILDPIGRR